MSESRKKTALVVEGGAMRGIYSAGVLDAFIEADYYDFDLCVGVSAGATNLAAYLAKMYRRNYTVYTKYSIGKDFINPWKFFRGGNYVDLDWLWEITIRELRLDLRVLAAQPARFLVGVTDAASGTCTFMEPGIDDMEVVLKASSAIPVMYRGPVRVEGKPYWDGGVSDPIPVREAIRRGAEKVVVIRSRKRDFVMKPPLVNLMSRFSGSSSPMAAAVRRRADVYNETLAYMRSGDHGAEIHEICPPDSFTTSRLTRDKAVLDKDYLQGLEDGRAWLEKHVFYENESLNRKLELGT